MVEFDVQDCRVGFAEFDLQDSKLMLTLVLPFSW